MATDGDAIPGLIEEDVEVAYDPTGDRAAAPAVAATTMAQSAKPEARATHPQRLGAHERPTGQFSADDLERHTEVTTPGRRLRDTLEMDALAIEALTILSNKDTEEIEDLENTLRESRRPRSRH